MPFRASFYTLGCKLNQLETDAIAEAFAREGALVRPFASGGDRSEDLVVVNTCTVTVKADRSARRTIRLALETRPRAVVIATGCYAQVEAGVLSAIDGRVLALPGSVKAALLGLPRRLAESGLLDAGQSDPAALLDFLRGALAAGADAMADPRFAYDPKRFAFHSRPALKIQDGCDNDCAYCRVRIARGPAASLSAPEVLSRARALEAAGRAEIVLTGVNLSQYRDGGMAFPGLLGFLLEGTESLAFRVSSYEPDAIDQAFLDAFAHPRVRPHVHLAVQSGSDPLLRAMGRRYSRSDVLDAARALRAFRDEPFIAADLIVGFPGETAEDFAASLELARDCDFAWIHAFRFSSRPGTRAASLPDAVPERIAGERARALFELALAAKSNYVERWRGRELKAVLERDLCATTENYLKLKPRGLPESARPGQEILCRVEGKPEEAESEPLDAASVFLG
jgi:threonylcarbamoyladenosine tRNA methylthiotransferase MtaB